MQNVQRFKWPFSTMQVGDVVVFDFDEYGNRVFRVTNYVHVYASKSEKRFSTKSKKDENGFIQSVSVTRIA